MPEGGFAQRKAILVTAQSDPYNSHVIPSQRVDKYNRFRCYHWYRTYANVTS